MRDRKCVGSRERSLSFLSFLPRRERPVLAGKGSVCFNRPEYLMSVICLVRLFYKNCRIISNFLLGLNDKQTTPDSFVYLGGDVKRLVYALPAPDLQSKLVANTQKIPPDSVFILAFPLDREKKKISY